MTFELFRQAVFTLAVAPSLYYVVCVVAAIFYQRRRPSDVPKFLPPISLLKPVRGLDRHGYENFASYCCLDYPRYEILFCVDEQQGLAVPVIEAVMREHPHIDARLLVGAQLLGVNPR